MGNAPSYSSIAQLQWYLEAKKSFTHDAFVAASAHFDPADVPELALQGKIVLVFGGNKGFGLECAVRTAELGAAVVHVVSRNAAKCAEASAELEKRAPTAVAAGVFVHHAVDFTLLAETRRFAELVASRSGSGLADGIDVIFNNAAYMPRTKTMTSEGHEVMAAMIIGSSLLLPAVALPALREGARIVNISTSAACLVKANWTDLDCAAIAPEKYDGGLLYAVARKTQVYLTRLLNDRVRERRGDVRIVAMHPGWSDVAPLRNGQPEFYKEHVAIMRTVAEGIDTAVFLACAPLLRVGTGGEFFFERKPTSPDYTLASTKASERDLMHLWCACVAYVGGHLPAIGVDGAQDDRVLDELDSRSTTSSSSCT